MFKKIVTLVSLLLFTFSIYACSSQQSLKNNSKDLEKERNEFKTNLLKKVKAPQDYQDEAPPVNVSEIIYQSGDLSLKAWMSKKPDDDKKHPAVVYAHGGFAFGDGDWNDIKPYLDAGFIVMTPTFRGENGNPGNFEFLYGEVDDLINAGKYLASQQYIDSNRIFLAGHSTGGTLAMLVALMPSQYSAIATFGASPDQKYNFSHGWGKYAPFDLKNSKEIELRSPIEYIECLQKPLYVYVGKDDKSYKDSSAKLSEKVDKIGHEIKLSYIDGDHFTSLKKSIEESIKVFKDK
jgi:dipeptidyl aminopeptidase/acylaminoacyl peptidase